MPRADRHSIPGQVWQLTHRCHKQQWLLKFHKDRLRWIHWLFKAREHFGRIAITRRLFKQMGIWRGVWRTLI